MNNCIFDTLVKIAGSNNVFKDEPMKKRCTFKTGGNAAYFIEPQNPSQVAEIVKYAKKNKIPFFVVGNGSNLLVSDDGFDGIIICIGKNMSDVMVSQNRVTAMAGATLAKVASVAQKNSLSGFEFASGIPGTVGGAVYMNAGAYGGEMKDVAIKTTYIDASGNIKVAYGDEHCFGYRTSLFKNGGIVVECEFELKKGNPDQIAQLMADYNNRRKQKQPLEYPSAGSTFKRPEGYFAGKLIEDSELGGYTIGGAAVSDKHKGFIINKGGATTADIISLICYVQKTVYKNYGVLLEPEVQFLGEGSKTYKP